VAGPREFLILERNIHFNLSKVTFERISPFRPLALQNGNMTPFTGYKIQVDLEFLHRAAQKQLLLLANFEKRVRTR